MQDTEKTNEAACAPSRAAEGGANLTAVLGTSEAEAVPVSCECGRGHMVTLPNGERCCSDTLRKFELQNGRPYRAVPNVEGKPIAANELNEGKT